jgi:hypothetical protein
LVDVQTLIAKPAVTRLEEGVSTGLSRVARVTREMGVRSALATLLFGVSPVDASRISRSSTC